ncbi:hypothetical protein LUZ61_017191 [Rhynchospora tenuis]|uniref:DUF4220 domain-containing protein n=1 Tax=Rhynchospora tenuis TaxID=198213 RepID=A0AAD5Z6X2_9POAL|nr:hypothetical protein LUZ61_017191 [Rhynchospora tenuis]
MDKNQYSCTSEFGAEVLMVITSFIIVAIAIYYFYTVLASLVQKNRNHRQKLSDKDADIFLSMALHALFLPLMSYLFSQAKQNNSEGRAQLILVWMVLIEFIQVRAFDSTWELKKSAEQLVRLVWVGFLVYGYEPPDSVRTTLFVLCAFSFIYEILKGISFNKCRDSYFIGKNPKLIHNYMKRVMLEDDLKTTPINCCDYVVMSEENHEIIVSEKGCIFGDKKANSEGKLTIGRVFQLNSSEDEAFTLAHPDWRNNCLSLALAKMLQRRIVNLSLDEAGNRKALEFVLDGRIRCSNPDAKAKTVFDIKVNGRILAFLAKWTRRILGTTVFHSTDVKETILRSLKTLMESGGQLTNGETALQRHGIWENLNLVYRPSGSTTEAILVWHIATTLFHHQNFSPEPNNNPFFNNYSKVILALIRYKLIPRNLLCHEESPSQQNNDHFKKEREVALALSSYCLYLVAYLPDLLPDEVEWTEKLYESVREEIFAIDRSSGQKHTRKNRCNYAMGVDTWGENSVVGKGVKVAQMLMLYAERGKEVWTMLSDFWAEIMLFIAPSDNVKGHEEILEKEELFTQLWALLTHAGIVTRPKPTQPCHVTHAGLSILPNTIHNKIRL